MARKRTEAATELSKEIKAKGKFTRAKKSMKRTTSTITTTKKSPEPGKHNSEREEKKSPSKCSAESPSSEHQKSIHTETEPQGEPVLDDLHSSKEVRSSKKMKLQLFPLDARTREGLEKDGFHPYLELTLSSRKKISSVLQHIHSKWGSSGIARGDPTLYSYDKSILASSHHKWIANCKITTGDVYAAIGSPSLFRIRYGWSFETGNKTDEQLLQSPSTPGTFSFQNEELQNNVGNGFTDGLDNQFTTPSAENQVTDTPQPENLPPDGQIESTEYNNGSTGPTMLPCDLSIGGLFSEASLNGNFGNRCKQNSNAGNANTIPWDDLSIGGLLASFQDRGEEDEGRFNSDRRAITEQEQQQQLPIISDSLDAFFFANRSNQAPLPPHQPLTHSSILDAEDTCHAFSFRKRTTTTSHNVLEQVSEESEAKEQQKDESKTAESVFGSSMLFNQDSSLGFSAIKWGDSSRGPFDVGFSSSRKFGSGGDSISFGALVKDFQETTETLEEENTAKLQ